VNRKIVIGGLVSLAICLIVIGVVNQSKKAAPPKEEGKSEADALYNTAISWQSKGELDKAAKLYQEMIKGFPNFKEISAVEERLWDLNIKILFSPLVTEKDIIYKVKPGDTLGKVAAKYNTTVDLIRQSNNLKGDLIRPGKRLKVSCAKYSIVVDKSQNSLILKADDEIFKIYSVATGKYNCTPVGTFKIVEKLKNPPWYRSGAGPISADSPENILGTRWLGLSEPEYGIHGGAVKEDLGNQVTEGCIRMLDSDVEELFSILPRQTEIVIVD